MAPHPPYVPGSATSKAAASQVKPRRPNKGIRIFRSIRGDASGYTCEEIELMLSMRHQTVSARLVELVACGCIRLAGVQRLTSAEAPAEVYEAIPGATEDLYLHYLSKTRASKSVAAWRKEMIAAAENFAYNPSQQTIDSLTAKAAERRSIR